VKLTILWMTAIFSMLGEASTTEITRRQGSQGFIENRHSARAGGTVAGNARRDLESKSGRRVVSSENYRGLTQTATKKFSKKLRRLSSEL